MLLPLGYGETKMIKNTDSYRPQGKQIKSLVSAAHPSCNSAAALCINNKQVNLYNRPLASKQEATADFRTSRYALFCDVPRLPQLAISQENRPTVE